MASLISLLLAVALLVLAGCGNENTDDTRAAAVVKQDPATNPQVMAKLAQADVVDGTADKLISQCAGCALRMTGDATHTIEVGEYDMHFCSDACKGSFAEDLAGKIRLLSIPEVEDASPPASDS